jgi:hypothetical protein
MKIRYYRIHKKKIKKLSSREDLEELLVKKFKLNKKSSQKIHMKIG